MAGEDDPSADVERALRQVQRWLDSNAPVPGRHPDAADFAGYVEWLLAGAPDACPTPAVRDHAAECRECYRKAEDLAIAHLRAEREGTRGKRLSLTLHIGRGARERWVECRDELGRLVRRSLAPETSPGIALEARPLLLRERAPEGLAPEYGPTRAEVPAQAEGVGASVILQAEDRGLRIAVLLRHPEAGDALPGATVTLSSARGKALHTAVTDAHGSAAFRSLTPRTYRIEITPT